MKQHRQLGIRKNFYIVLGTVLSAGCSAAVYPASECKPPPPPLTVPNSPRSQCREVSTEHAKEWPQIYKDIQYNEENAVYWMRAAFIDLSDKTQKELKSEFASALAEMNSVDGKYLQLVDAAAGSKGGEYAEATKMLSEAVGKFVEFLNEHVKGAALTSGAQKNITKAKAAYQQLKSKAQPPATSSEDEQPSSESTGKDEQPSPAATAEDEEKQ